MLKKLLNIHLLSILILSGFFYYFFNFSIYSLIALVVGAIITFIIINGHVLKTVARCRAKKTNNRKIQNGVEIPLIITGLLASYFFSGDIEFATAFLIGANLSAFYCEQMKTASHKISILNAIILFSIVFESSIVKLRGANKLPEEVRLTLPVVLLSIIAFYFLFKFIKSVWKKSKTKYQNYLASSFAILLLGVLWGLSYIFFKEIGTEIFFIPAAAGLLAGVTQTFIRQKSILTDINEIILITLVPYQISGLMGVALAFMIGLIFAELSKDMFEKNTPVQQRTLYKIAPVIFLITAAEIRENEGLITRFNLVTGYQIGWLFLSVIIFNYAQEYFAKIKKILIDNEIKWAYPLTTSIFTITALTLIIKFGRDEALAGLIIIGSLYLFFLSLAETKNKIVNFKFVLSIAQVFGSIAFLVLTKI